MLSSRQDGRTDSNSEDDVYDAIIMTQPLPEFTKSLNLEQTQC